MLWGHVMWVWCSQIIYHCGARCGRVLFEIHCHRKSNITLRAIAKQLTIWLLFHYIQAVRVHTVCLEGVFVMDLSPIK